MPANPWQAATALGKRLRVTSNHGEREHGDVWGVAIYSHPTEPLRYVVDLEGDRATYSLERFGAGDPVVLKAGDLDPDVAHVIVRYPKRAEHRRMPAWNMLQAGASA